MNQRHERGLSHHPAPHRDVAGWPLLMFILAGGPLAWFIQLSVGYALTSCPVKQNPERGIVAIIYISCLLTALGALFAAYRLFGRVREEGEGDHRHLLEIGGGRTRFLALWGVLLSGGFAGATAISLLWLILVPSCAY